MSRVTPSRFDAAAGVRDPKRELFTCDDPVPPIGTPSRTRYAVLSVTMTGGKAWTINPDRMRKVGSTTTSGDAGERQFATWRAAGGPCHGELLFLFLERYDSCVWAKGRNICPMRGKRNAKASYSS
jgi:hypothetical protein